MSVMHCFRANRPRGDRIRVLDARQASLHHLAAASGGVDVSEAWIQRDAQRITGLGSKTMHLLHRVGSAAE